MSSQEMLVQNMLDLPSLFDNLLDDNCQLHMKRVENTYEVNDTLVFDSYLTIQVDDAHKAWVQRFLNELVPLYEQLTLYDDYYNLRMKTLKKDLIIKNTMMELKQDTKVVARELFTRAIDRVEIIESQSFSDIEDKNKLRYLAENTPTTLDIFDSIIISLLNNPGLFSKNTEDTNKELADCFESSQELINAVLFNPNDETVVTYLANTLIDFYSDLKDVIDGLKGRIVRLK